MLKNIDSYKHATLVRKLKYVWLYVRASQALNANMNYIWWKVLR